MYTDKYNYSNKCMHTHIIVHLVLHIVDIHEKGTYRSMYAEI